MRYWTASFTMPTASSSKAIVYGVRLAKRKNREHLAHDRPAGSCARGQHLAARDFVAWCKAQPGSEVLGIRPCPQIGATLADELQCQRWTQPMDLSQIDAEQAVQRGPDIEGGRV